MIKGLVCPAAEAVAGHPHRFDSAVREHLGQVPGLGTAAFANTAVLLEEAAIGTVDRLASVLDRALRQVVTNYFADERIRNIYALDPAMQHILSLCGDREYSVGAYRPDVLFDRTGQPRLCEIGARYPMNGWIVSHLLATLGQSYPGCYPSMLRALPEQGAMLDAIADLFAADDAVLMVRDREPGTEVFTLLRLLEQRGVHVRFATPHALRLHDGAIHNGHDGRAFTQFILELDREELRTFDPQVLRHLAQHGVCLNDIRTIILVHDKRVLAVLYDEEIMADYLHPEEYCFLRPFLIPSFSLHDAGVRAMLAASNENWILKRNSGGRGVDMHVGATTDPGRWRHLIAQEWPSYMAQPYIEQRSFTDPATSDTVRFVGMLLLLNDRSFGPGAFRGSSEHLINIHQGRGRLFPAMLQ